VGHLPENPGAESLQRAACHACEQAAAGLCKRCGKPYCPDHSAGYCTRCGRLLQESRRRGVSPDLLRCLAWGAALAFPTLVAGFCAGARWDGETDGGVELGVLLWPIWAAFELFPLRGPGWLLVGPVVQWAGYALLVFAARLGYRGFRAVLGVFPHP
jgi:hypothetical protein